MSDLEDEVFEIVYTRDGEQWCKYCYSFGCAANHCNCGCHLHPKGMCCEVGA